MTLIFPENNLAFSQSTKSVLGGPKILQNYFRPGRRSNPAQELTKLFQTLIVGSEGGSPGKCSSGPVSPAIGIPQGVHYNDRFEGDGGKYANVSKGRLKTKGPK